MTHTEFNVYHEKAMECGRIGELRIKKCQEFLDSHANILFGPAKIHPMAGSIEQPVVEIQFSGIINIDLLPQMYKILKGTE